MAAVAAGTSTVLIVDDDPGFRAFARALLARAGYDVDEAATGESALAQAELRTPALVLLDVRLPGTSGYEVCRELRERFGDDLGIVFVSGERADQLDRVSGLLLGADAYLTKPFDPDELLARARRLVRTRAVERARAEEAGFELTPREREVLSLLADGLRQTEIAGELFISPRTVGTHIQRILGKLGVHSRAQAVAAAHRHALV